MPDETRSEDALLDMELELTFPASDPIPWIHESKADQAGRPGRHSSIPAPLYLDDFKIGQRFVSGSLVVSEDDVKAFASKYDPQPFHLNEDAAAQSMFEGLAASGWHTSALTMRLLVDSDMRVAGGLVGVGGELTWPRPTRPGDVLRVETEVLEVRRSRSKPDRGIVTMRNLTLNQRGEAVQIAVMKLIVPRKS